MDIFGEVAAAQRRERQREETFASVASQFGRLTREDQILLLARLANLLEAKATQLGLPAPQTKPAAPANGKAEALPPLAPPTVSRPQAAPPPDVSQMTATQITRHVVRNAPAPLPIDEIITRVLNLRPETSKPEIYSATYKSAGRDEFLKDGDLYRYNPTFRPRRAGGGR